MLLWDISVIYQWYWESGKVPVTWKLTNIIADFKKGKKEDPNNYRSVSLTLVPGKIIEIIMGVIEKYSQSSVKGNMDSWRESHALLTEKSS